MQSNLSNGSMRGALRWGNPIVVACDEAVTNKSEASRKGRTKPRIFPMQEQWGRTHPRVDEEQYLACGCSILYIGIRWRQNCYPVIRNTLSSRPIAVHEKVVVARRQTNKVLQFA